MRYKIEKDVPPPAARNIGGQHKYPWKEMVAGDSFWTEEPGITPIRLQQRLYQSAYGYCKRYRKDLRVLTQRQGHGVRVWLVKRPIRNL
jgi:hypothetical protein